MSKPEDTTSLPGVAWIDGEFCAVQEARIPVLDWGLLRSDATYDVVHVWNGRFFRIDDHIDRFEQSIEKLRMTLPFDRTRLKSILAQCVRQADFENAYVEMVLTRGMSPDFNRDPRAAINRFFAFAIPFGWIATEQQRENGLQIGISEVQRIAPESVDPTIKNYHWLDFVQGLLQGYDAGHDNIVMTDNRGNITEGPGFNVFLVEDGTVSTPSSGVLEGVTRQSVFDLCNENGIPVEMVPVARNRLTTADEVFISSTAGGLMPVTRVDGTTIASGSPGPVTRRLVDWYWQRHADPDWSTAVEDLLP